MYIGKLSQKMRFNAQLRFNLLTGFYRRLGYFQNLLAVDTSTNYSSYSNTCNYDRARCVFLVCVWLWIDYTAVSEKKINV